MWSFQYKHGDRPLDGYTVLRAAGRGGFGEVYQAVSDGGREVALKAILGYEQVELRGVAQCMNLKSPHLVTTFDVRHNAAGRPFVIMEFISGPSLRQLLDESPAGLGPQKAAFFLREIAKGLTYLHDCGIVHRDLKPGNIFFENGAVKIGDYGLSKAITTTQHSGQTVTVGTVHYMAPEIGAGRYDRGIDIYALGAVLYELLTGTVPYVGATPTEILLKHLSAEPDVTNVPEPFATVIKRAMAKDPARRYQSAQEMVEAVFGAEHVRESMSVFSTEELSIVAERAARRIPVGAVAAGSPVAEGGAAVGLLDGRPGSSSVSVTGGGAGNKRLDFWHRIADAVDRVVYTDAPRPAPAVPPPAVGRPAATTDTLVSLADPMSQRQRWVVASVASVVIAIAAGLLTDDRGWHSPVGPVLFTLTSVWGGALGLIFVVRRIVPGWQPGQSPGLARITAAVLIASAALLASIPAWPLISRPATVVGMWTAIAIVMFLLKPAKWVAPDRKARVIGAHLVHATILGLVLGGFSNAGPHLPFAVLAGICMVVQVVVPWHPRVSAADAARAGWAPPPAPRPPVNPPPVIPVVPGSASPIGQGGPADVPPPPVGKVRRWWQCKTHGRRKNNQATAAAAVAPPAAPPQAYAEAAPAAPARWASQPAEPRPPLSERLWEGTGSLTGALLSTAGGLAVLLAMLVGLAAVMLPSFVGAGLAGPRVVSQLKEIEAANPAWWFAVQRLATASALVLGLFGTGAMLLGRRRHGLAHVARGALAAVALVGSLMPLYATVQIDTLASLDNRKESLQEIGKLLEPQTVLPAALSFFVAVVLLAWPPRRRARAAAGPR